MMQHKSDQPAIGYLIRLAAVVLGWVAFSVTFTVLVDPYRMYGTPGIPGWTELKPRVYQQSDIAKTRQLERAKPKTLLLGNSRVEIGFDPESKVWPASYRPVFNAAEAGRGLPTALEMLRDDIAIRAPQTVFLGLDFQDFLSTSDQTAAPAPSIAPDESHAPFSRQRTLQIWRDRIATTLTLDALSDSVLTVLDQDPVTTTTMTWSGFNPLHEYRLYARRTGYYGLFLAKAQDYQEQYSRYRIPDFTKRNGLANFRDLATIAALAHGHNIQLVFFTQPYHADYLEMLHRVGLWPSFEQWKLSVVQFAAAEDVPLYDFAEYNAFTTEGVPGPGDTTKVMHWYWEPGHYKEALGNEMLQAMITGTSASFGRRLTPTNVDQAIIDIRNQRTPYLLHRHQIEATQSEGR